MATPEIETCDLGVQRREMMIAPGTWNAEARTVDVTFTTGARRRMFDWSRWDYVDEELSLDSGAIRFDRINNLVGLLGYPRPRGAHKNNDSDCAVLQVLLVAQVLVRGFLVRNLSLFTRHSSLRRRRPMTHKALQIWSPRWGLPRVRVRVITRLQAYLDI
jgi:hypothetical protein